MKSNALKYMFLLMVSMFTLASCSESGEEDGEEFADWQARNEQAFADTLTKAQQEGEAKGWYIYPCWSMENQTPNVDANGNKYTPSFDATKDNIVVKVLGNGEGSEVRLNYTDSVEVSYKGYLIPSKTYASGYIFDSTFTGTYNKDKALTQRMLISNLVDGFTTALLKMNHIGDDWLVTMPYSLGYGTTQSSSSTIPAYSMLTFEIVLRGYYKDDKWVRE